MFRKILVTIFTLLLSTLSFAQTTPFNKLVIFGDSLSDNGNIYNLTLHMLPKSPPYYKGQFSNGRVWASILADDFQKLSISTENWSLGGEPAVYHNPFDGFLPISLSEVISAYLAHDFLHSKAATLYIIWIGANDYLNGPKDVASATDAVVNKIHDEVELLASQGGKNFLVMNLPDLAATPSARDNDLVDVLHTLTVTHNLKLLGSVSKIEKEHPEIVIHYFDVYSIFSDLIANPQKYNQQYHTQLSNLQDSCWKGHFALKNQVELKNKLMHEIDLQLAKNANTPQISSALLADYIIKTPSLREAYNVANQYDSGTAPCANPENYVFWDHVHPTSQVHGIFESIIADYIKQHYVVG